MADSAPKPVQLFEDSEIGGDARTTAGVVWARMDARRHVLRTALDRILDAQKWNDAVRAYNNDTLSWQQKHAQRYSQANSGGDPNQLRLVLRDAEKAILELQHQLTPFLVEAEMPQGWQAGMDYIVNGVWKRIADREREFETKLKEATDELIGMKRELILQNAFARQVSARKTRAERAALMHSILFAAALSAIIAAQAFIQKLAPALDWHVGALLRLGAAAPLAFLAYFFLQQQKIERLIALKSEHVEALLRGGARELAAMLAPTAEKREATLQEIHERLADEILRIDDVVGAITKFHTPMDDVERIAKAIGRKGA